MRSRQRPSARFVVAALALASVVLAACTGNDDEQPEGLTDIRDTEPREDDDAQPEADEADPADEVSDEPEATDAGDDTDDGDDGEAATGGEDGSDTSEPEDAEDDGSEVQDAGGDGETTVAGVVVPEDAFQVNDEIDLDEDAQREYLQFVLDAYLYTTQALNTGEWDPSELARYFAGGELERNRSGFERYEEDGLRQINDGTVVDRIRVTRWDGGGVVVHQCVTRGPDDGVIDVETGDYTFQSDEPQRSLTTSLALVEIADERFDYRIVEILNGEQDECA